MSESDPEGEATFFAMNARSQFFREGKLIAGQTAAACTSSTTEFVNAKKSEEWTEDGIEVP